MKTKLFFLFVFLLILMPVISAEEFGYNYLEGELNVVQAINYTLISVNDSLLWDGNVWDESRWVFTAGDTMTGNLVLPVGTEPLPALSFGDGDTGLYLQSNNILGVSVAGTQRFRFTTSTFISADAGGPGLLNDDATSTVPTIYPDRVDTDTGIGHAAADQLSLIAGGAEIMRLSNTSGTLTSEINGTLNVSGNIYSGGSQVLTGVSDVWVNESGDTMTGDLNISNNAHLILPQTNDVATPTIAFGDGDTGLYESVDDSLKFATGGALQFTLASTGFYGASGKVQLSLSTPSATVPNLIPARGDGDTGIGRAAADQLSLIAGGVEGMRIVEADDAVKVGIGTGNPEKELHIKVSESGATPYLWTNLAIERDTNTGLSIITPNDSIGYITFGDPEFAADGYIRYDHATRKMILRAGSTANHLVLTPNLRVGIGTDSPTSKLEVSEGRIAITETTSNDYAVLQFNTDASVLRGGFFMAGSTATGYGGANSLNLINIDAYPLAFGTSNSVDMLIDGTGKVGIGTTSPGADLEIFGVNPVFSINATANSWLKMTRLSAGRTNEIQFLTTALPAYPWILGNLDSSNPGTGYEFFIGRETGGLNADFVIDTSGNVGIGTTSPSQSLHVEGNLNVTGTSYFGGNITLINGGKVWDNSTCTFIASPDGTNIQSICNT